MPKANRDKAKGLARDFKIDRSKLNEDKREIELAFSSEQPVERWGENEVLSHEKGDYDFSRLNDSHPLLLGHDEWNPGSQIGVIESARVDSDKIGRAIVRFGQSDLATEIWNDVKDGIRKLISVGYDRTGIVKSDKAKDGRVTTRYKWMPSHIAIVPVPADTAVGVGRAMKRKCADCDGNGRCGCRAKEDDDADDDCESCGGDGDCSDCGGTGYFTSAKSKQVDFIKLTDADIENSTPEQKKQMRILLDKAAGDSAGTITIAERDSAVAAERTKVAGETQTAERTRVKEIAVIADALVKDHAKKNGGKMGDEIRKAANAAIEAGETVKDFQLRVLQDVQKAKPAVPILLEDCADENGQRDYSILKGAQDIVRRFDATGERATIPGGLEGEVHQEMVRRSKDTGGLGFPQAGFMVPINARVRTGAISNFDLRQRERLGKRDMQATVFPSGGAFVPTTLLPPVIELLRNRMILELCGKRTLGGLTGNIIIPRQEAPATAYSVSEIGLLPASQQILGQISLNPKRVGAYETYSKQFVMQSTPDAEAFIRDDLFKIIALLWDFYGIAGSGVNSQPLGIFNTPGINAITFGATPTYAKIVDMVTAIEAANVTGDLCYITTPTVKGALKKVAVALSGATTVAAGKDSAIWIGKGMDGEVNGLPAYQSNQVPNNQVACGDFQQLIHAMWGGLDVIVDPYSKAANAEIVITMNTWGDYALRHPQAFTVSTDAGNQ